MLRMNDRLRPFAPGLTKFVMVTFGLWSVGAMLMVNSVVALSLLLTYAAVLSKMYQVDVEPVLLLMTHSVISGCMFYDATSTVCVIIAAVTSLNCMGTYLLHGDRLTVVSVSVLVPGLMQKPQAILACVLIGLVIGVSRLRPVRPHSLLLMSLTVIGLILPVSRAAGSILIFLLMGIVTTLFVANKSTHADTDPTNYTTTVPTETDHTHAIATPSETETVDTLIESINSLATQIQDTIEATPDESSTTVATPTDNVTIETEPDGNKHLVVTPTDNEIIDTTPDGNTTVVITPTDNATIETTADGNTVATPSENTTIVTTPNENTATYATTDESTTAVDTPTESIIQVSPDDDLPLEPAIHHWHNNNNSNIDDDNIEFYKNDNNNCVKSEMHNGGVPNGYLQMSCTTESLDLQGHTVSGAIKVLIAYLRECEDVYRENRTNHLRHVTIITGEGDVTESVDEFDPDFSEFDDLDAELGESAGSPLLIKPTVVHFLTINKYKFDIPTDTPGLVKVDLESHVT